MSLFKDFKEGFMRAKFESGLNDRNNKCIKDLNNYVRTYRKYLETGIETNEVKIAIYQIGYLLNQLGFPEPDLTLNDVVNSDIAKFTIDNLRSLSWNK